MSVEIRQARPEDLEGVVDLLSAAFGYAREWFEAAIFDNPSWTPDQSWLAVEDGRLLAHARVLRRRIRTHGVVLPVAGVGEVGTLPEEQGKGLAGRVLEVALDAARGDGLPYSLLWSRAGRLYLRLGFVQILYPRLRLRVSGTAEAVRPFEPADLAEVMRLQRAVGPVERTPADWDFELRHRSPDALFLVERQSAGELTGYLRARPGSDAVELLDLGLMDCQPELARPLLVAAAGSAAVPLEGPLPRALRDGLRGSAALKDLPPGDDLMGRALDRRALEQALGGGLADLDEAALAQELWRDFTPWPADKF